MPNLILAIKQEPFNDMDDAQIFVQFLELKSIAVWELIL